MTRYTFVNTLAQILPDTAFREAPAPAPSSMQRRIWHKVTNCQEKIGDYYRISGYRQAYLERLEGANVFGVQSMTFMQATQCTIWVKYCKNYPLPGNKLANVHDGSTSC